MFMKTAGIDTKAHLITGRGQSHAHLTTPGMNPCQENKSSISEAQYNKNDTSSVVPFQSLATEKS